MVDGHCEDPTHKPEVLQVMLIALARVRVDLQRVVITRERGESVSNLLYTLSNLISVYSQ